MENTLFKPVRLPPDEQPLSAGSSRASISRRSMLIGMLASPLVWGGQSVRTGQRIFDVAIIGAGVFGSWIAWHLARRGLSVALVDAYEPGNGLSSSGGETRVIRVAYGPDTLYSDWVLQALPQWRALDQRSRASGGAPLFYPLGVLWMSGHRNRYFDTSLDYLRQQKVPHRLFERRQTLAAAFPALHLQGVEYGFLENNSGALAARLAVRHVAAEAQAAGVHWRHGHAGQPQPVLRHQQKLWRVPLAKSADSIVARQVVYACGAWLPYIFPDILSRRIVPTRQEVFYLDSRQAFPPGKNPYSANHFPVWADFNDGDVFYGIPDVSGYGFKIAHDKHGPPINPDTANRHMSATAEAEIRAYLHKRFPELATAPLRSVRVCQYENTSNGDFLLDRHPHMDGVWLAGGGSGHGFKHGPVVGEYMADLITGARQATHPRFTLASKKTTQQRQVV